MVVATWRTAEFKMDNKKHDIEVFVLVNPKSGGQAGEKVFQEMSNEVGAERCYFLQGKQGLKQEALERLWELLSQMESFKTLVSEAPSAVRENPHHEFVSTGAFFRVIAAGGDGTVAWVLACMDELEHLPPFVRIPVAHLPLGTGNDFARATQWGGGYDGGHAKRLVQQVREAGCIHLDRWKMKLENLMENAPAGERSMDLPFQNYCSFGCDAAIARAFEDERQKHPEKFTSRTRNKMIYSSKGTATMFNGSGFRVKSYLEVIPGTEKDAVPVPLPGPTQTIIIQNIPSYMGGIDVWGNKGESLPCVPCLHKTEGFHAQSMSDGQLEAIAFFSSIHQGSAAVFHHTGKRVAQAPSFVIQGKPGKIWYFQVDGEAVKLTGEGGFRAQITLGRRSEVLVRKK
ncbi:Diacylglycerol kinase gamma [Porphyridium purpureum]|uniref:Diacylglycerol kinase n=1 Tax=Porphyridium purpureum TaxID=35688 RepID=A0A5J4YYL2_PORPP|nr:Diacylglycerol kinase gamma [Porphyridium purpureum]|eukprot:POR8353..scf209_3